MQRALKGTYTFWTAQAARAALKHILMTGVIMKTPGIPTGDTADVHAAQRNIWEQTIKKLTVSNVIPWEVLALKGRMTSLQKPRHSTEIM